MNRWIGIGRWTKDVEARYTEGNQPTCIARGTLAVDRAIKKEGQQSADFISIVAFGKTAEFLEKYAQKGVKMAVEGRVQTGSYEKDGAKVYTTDIVAERVEFCESKKAESESKPANDDFIDITDSIGTELPFV